MIKNCGSCRFVTFQMTKHNPPRIKHQAASKCKWIPPEIKIPDSVFMLSENRRLTITTGYVTPSMGHTCPCYEARVEVE